MKTRKEVETEFKRLQYLIDDAVANDDFELVKSLNYIRYGIRWSFDITDFSDEKQLSSIDSLTNLASYVKELRDKEKNKLFNIYGAGWYCDSTELECAGYTLCRDIYTEIEKMQGKLK